MLRIAPNICVFYIISLRFKLFHQQQDRMISQITLFLLVRAGPVSKLILCVCVVCVSEMISRPLVGRKYECYIVIEVIDLDELDEGNISAATLRLDRY